jgi:hypothetical protein
MEVLPQQYVLDSMRLFAEEVMPQFKKTLERAPQSDGASQPLAVGAG